MTNQMFCYQCEQTAGCSACTGAAGVCGKRASTALLQDELTSALTGSGNHSCNYQVSNTYKYAKQKGLDV